MSVVYYTRFGSAIGPVWVAATDEGVCAVGLGSGQPERLLAWLARHIGSESRPGDTPLLAAAVAGLREYLVGERREFHLPLDQRGTPFRRQVWDEVAAIPYGTVVSYGEIARRIGRPLAARAVGGAVGANPLPIIVPCHRVVGVNGALVGYGAGLEIKAALLRLENVLLT